MNAMIMVCHSLNNNTRTALVISFCLNANPLISLISSEWPQILGIYSVVVLWILVILGSQYSSDHYLG